jgi:hypothetical protein
MEDDFKKGMQPKTIKSKNNNIFLNGRRPQFLYKCKKTTKNNYAKKKN